jgi:hypothetical protein
MSKRNIMSEATIDRAASIINSFKDSDLHKIKQKEI